MQITTPIRRALTTSSTASAFATLIPTLTEPTGDGIFAFDGLTPDKISAMFFGAGSDNHAFDFQLIGWDKIGQSPPFVLWIPKILAKLTVTLSALVGVASSSVINTDRFADTIITFATAIQGQARYTDTDSGGASTRGGVEIYSTAGDLFPAWAEIPLRGVSKIQFDFDLGSGTNCNALWRTLNSRD